MNSILETIVDLRKNNDFDIDTTNSDRYRIVINEQNGTKTSYYFSTPIYNIYSRKLVDLKFTGTNIPYLIGSNSKIFFSDNIKMNNSDGTCFISSGGKIKRVSDYELRDGENIILPTTNGFVYKIPINESSTTSICVRTDRAFSMTRSNNKYFALMIDKFTPFMSICAVGAEDTDGRITSPFIFSNRKISDFEYEISMSKFIGTGKYFVFEINMYEKKLIQDTTVESANANTNNAFGSSAYLGTTAEFGEQWLYSRIDYFRMSAISDCRIKNVTAYIPKLGSGQLDVDAYKVSERFCSFGSTWTNKKSGSNFINRSHNTDRHIVLDITNALIHQRSKQIIATSGLILKAAQKGSFTSITTADSCFLPQIIAFNYY